MIKKMWKITMVAFLGVLFLAPDLFAFPVLGYVDPGFGSGYSLSTTKVGTATYTFKNLVSGSNLNLQSISLDFEKDVFDMDNTSPVSGSLPPGWYFAPPIDLGTYSFQITFTPGFGIPEGGELSFQMDYTLWDDALSLDWDEGGYWEQGFGVKYTGVHLLVPGGSTAPVPEPATMLLFGISLITVAGYGRHRMNRNNS
ncbi:MAG: PEP-CTERM sorting domain-containing protein [Deltaproteobacteria bacterium]|nr:PEP-CTERM sorting domain-containing protein [Deltaproteobacteria bacterium]